MRHGARTGGSDELLAELSRANLFLIPLDDRGEWYRFHHLFAQLLRVELEHREPGLAPTLHRRAFSWHRDNGPVDEAIKHAVEAGAFDEAGDLIAAAWVDYVNVNRDATVLAWLDRFPRELAERGLAASSRQAWALTLCGQREAAAEAIAAIELMGRLDEGPLADGFSSVEASLATLRGFVTWGDVGGGLRYARRAPSSRGRRRAGGPPSASALAFSCTTPAHLDQSDAWLARVGRARTIARTVVHRLESHWPSARSSRATRGGSTSRRCSQRRRWELERDRGFEEVDGEAYVALGAALEAQQRFEEALAILERGLGILRVQGSRALARGRALPLHRRAPGNVEAPGRCRRDLRGESDFRLLPRSGSLAGARSRPRASRRRPDAEGTTGV